MRTLLVFLAVVVGGCAVRAAASARAGSGTPLPRRPPPAPRTSAIAGLMDSARADAAAGRLANAAASLERALRIEPRNPRLWQELARVRLKQGDYAQAESLAARSNSWAGSDGPPCAPRTGASSRRRARRAAMPQAPARRSKPPNDRDEIDDRRRGAGSDPASFEVSRQTPARTNARTPICQEDEG